MSCLHGPVCSSPCMYSHSLPTETRGHRIGSPDTGVGCEPSCECSVESQELLCVCGGEGGVETWSLYVDQASPEPRNLPISGGFLSTGIKGMSQYCQNTRTFLNFEPSFLSSLTHFETRCLVYQAGLPSSSVAPRILESLKKTTEHHL